MGFNKLVVASRESVLTECRKGDKSSKHDEVLKIWGYENSRTMD